MTLSFALTRFASFICVVLLGFVAGCGDSSDVPSDMGHQRDLPSIEPMCDYQVARYRITALHVPTEAEAAAGVAVGHNVDRVGDACAVPDFPGGVDNSLIALSSELTLFAPTEEQPDLQAVIDTALACAADADPSECRRLDLIVSVSTGNGCGWVEIEDGVGTTLAGPFVASLSAGNALHGQVPRFEFVLPYPTESGFVDLTLDIRNVIVTATVGDGALSDIVLGGAIEESAFEAMLMELLPHISGSPSFEEVEPILDNLYDVQVAGECAALSVGFTGSAIREPSATPALSLSRIGQKIPSNQCSCAS